MEIGLIPPPPLMCTKMAHSALLFIYIYYQNSGLENNPLDISTRFVYMYCLHTS